MTATIPVWTVRWPHDYRARIFESEDAALRDARKGAWASDPAVVCYPDGRRYAVFAIHDTVEITTEDRHGTRRTFGGPGRRVHSVAAGMALLSLILAGGTMPYHLVAGLAVLVVGLASAGVVVAADVLNQRDASALARRAA